MTEIPPTLERHPGHLSACHRADELMASGALDRRLVSVGALDDSDARLTGAAPTPAAVPPTAAAGPDAADRVEPDR